MSDIKTFVASKTFKTILWGIGGLIIILGVFAAGISVGLHKARYSYQWGANYERNFMGGPPRGMMGARGQGGPGGPMGFAGGFQGGDMRNAHGLAGTVTSVTGNTVVVTDRDSKENTVNVSDKTIIKAGNADIIITDLKTGEHIVVMGSPDSSGVINADLIRVFNNNNNPDTPNSAPAAPAAPAPNTNANTQNQ